MNGKIVSWMRTVRYWFLAAAAKSLQSCPTLCDPIDGSPPESPVPGILQARTLEWVAISFSNAWKWKVKVKSLSRIRLLATPWTAADHAPPSMGFSRQEYWSGVPLPSPDSLLSYRNSLLSYDVIGKGLFGAPLEDKDMAYAMGTFISVCRNSEEWRSVPWWEKSGKGSWRRRYCLSRYHLSSSSS